MKVYLQATELTRRVGDKTLFQGISLGIGEGQRVGLIAQNGTGKTTLLNILAGVDEPDGGEVVLRSGIKVGYLSQTPSFPDGMTVMDACFWHACQDRNDTEEALDLEVRSKQILGKLKIGDTSRKMSVLSGGQVKRVALANVLLQNPDLLILDEPTNHLDLEMIEWLEGYLGRQCITLLMVTHDRYFLDRVCNVILEMDDQTLYTYRGNYAYYLEKRQERIDNARAEIARANNLYRTELEWMRSTPQARSHKARYREEAFYELEKRAKRHIEEDKLRLLVNSTYIGSKIFEAEYVSKSFPAGEGREELVILKDFYYNFSRYEKMGIVGNNGTGKSTFLKLLLGLVAPDSGRFVIGETVKFGYFSQEPMQVDENMKVIDAVRRVAEYVDLGGGKHLTAMQFLQHFMFTPLQQQNYIYKLSGGERRRLQLCTVLMQNPNFLILDEPTNDMDIVTLQILEQYLQDFKGCVIIVSHDRYFMDKVVDHLLVFQGNGQVKDFPGNYTQFRESEKLLEKTENGKRKTENGGAEVKTENSSPSASGKPRLTEKKRKLTFKERQEYEQLESDIEALEQEKTAIEEALSSGTISVDEITAMSKRLPLLNDELDEKSMRWLELAEFA
ncbi:MAG: ABC-F family ATP-binding cassette domain-containing protein [Bacteroidaceae bacterium]|nr:ABC-F family ATP-binding cassette domain-containing protein [Bacteroidaceae bacterium]